MFYNKPDSYGRECWENGGKIMLNKSARFFTAFLFSFSSSHFSNLKSPVHFTPQSHLAFVQVQPNSSQHSVEGIPTDPFTMNPPNDISFGYQKFIPHISPYTLLVLHLSYDKHFLNACWISATLNKSIIC